MSRACSSRHWTGKLQVQNLTGQLSPNVSQSKCKRGRDGSVEQQGCRFNTKCNDKKKIHHTCGGLLLKPGGKCDISALPVLRGKRTVSGFCPTHGHVAGHKTGEGAIREGGTVATIQSLWLSQNNRCTQETCLFLFRILRCNSVRSVDIKFYFASHTPPF